MVKPKSLYRELTVALVALVSLVSIGASLFNYLHFSREAESSYESKSSEYAVYLREALEWPLWNLDDELIGQIGRAFASNAEIATLVIRDDQQRVVFRQEKPNGKQIRREIAIMHNGQHIGSVEIGLTLSVYEERDRQLLRASVATMALLIAVLLGATRWMLSRLLRKPVEAVVGATGDMVAGKYRQIALPETYTEFAPILSGFKTMSDAVASRESSLRQSNESLAAEIAERKRAEEALRASEERLHLATSAGSIGIWDWDVVNNVLTWDESMYTLYGIRREDFGGAYDAWSRMLHPDDRESTEGEIQAALRGEREYAPEFRIVRPDASVRIIKAASRTYRDAEGRPLRMIGTNLDISEQKLAEEELRRYKDHLEEEVQQRTSDLVLARNAADAANRAKSVFLASMSHELRTPLNAILGFSSMMRKDAQLRQEQREHLDIINRSGEHLLTLINDVLEMSKIEAGRVQVEKAPFDLGGLVRDVTDMMHVRAQEKGLRLLVEQSSEVPRYIRSDEARLRQVLINLVGNAVKFTRQGGVTVRFGVKPDAGQACLLIEVEDSGIGIRPEDQQIIFDPFVQLGEDASQKGTGLGLTLTRQYVQLMGGRIGVESKPGVGSVFRVELPLEKVEATDMGGRERVVSREILGLAAGQPERRILIVEDQLENQLLLSKLMNDLGLPVKVAENGEQAIELFLSWRPHLIWMDRRMPVMDGLEATRRIRQLPGGQSVKIVAVTASAFVEQRDEMLKAGMDGFVRKPYRFNEIYDCLGQQLGVEYRYADAPTTEPAGEATLTAEMLAVLPGEMREALRLALESLESERIAAVVQQVAPLDAGLHRILSRLADNYDYLSILKALQNN